MYTLDRNTVVAAYRAKHPDDLDPKENTLLFFDRSLHDAYEAEITKQAEKAGVPLTQFTRSVLSLYASLSPAKLPATRVKHALKYFDAVRPRMPTVDEPPIPPVTDEPEDADS
jgi:hypothetical protein